MSSNHDGARELPPERLAEITLQGRYAVNSPGGNDWCLQYAADTPALLDHIAFRDQQLAEVRAERDALGVGGIAVCRAAHVKIPDLSFENPGLLFAVIAGFRATLGQLGYEEESAATPTPPEATDEQH